MGLKKAIPLGIVSFIHYNDDAINTDIDESTGLPISDIEKYKEDFDFEKHCVLHAGKTPTIFKINFGITSKKMRAIKNSTFGGGGKDEDFGYKHGNYSFQVVRSVLSDIVNSPDVTVEQHFLFKRDSKTLLVSDETMEELENVGLVDDIFSFYTSKKSGVELKKK